MKVKRISEFKSAALVFVMLIFAVVAVLGGVAVGDEQDDEQDDEQTNNEQPILEISKIMTSGKTTVPVRTREYWTLEIAVTYNGQGDINNVRVNDKIPKGVTLIRVTPSKGKVIKLKIREDDNEEKKEKKEGKIIWYVGTMAPGDKETLILELTAKFKKRGEYSLNKGATVASKVGETKVKAGPTDQITVYAERKHKHNREAGGMGKDRDDDRDGGRWR